MLSLRNPTHNKSSAALLGLHFTHSGLILFKGDHIVGNEPVFLGNEGQVFLGNIPGHEGLKDILSNLPACGNGSLHEYIGKVVTGIEAVHLGGLDEAVHQRGCPGPFLGTMGNPVLGAKFYDFHQAFATIIIKISLGRKEYILNPHPVVQRVFDSPLERVVMSSSFNISW